MSNPWEAHQEAVAVASAAIGELQEGLSLCTERQESAMGAVLMAVGENPPVAAGQNALALTAQVKEKIDEIYTLTERIKEEMTNYGGGF
jgi:hypothetical protein